MADVDLTGEAIGAATLAGSLARSLVVSGTSGGQTTAAGAAAVDTALAGSTGGSTFGLAKLDGSDPPVVGDGFEGGLVGNPTLASKLTR